MVPFDHPFHPYFGICIKEAVVLPYFHAPPITNDVHGQRASDLAVEKSQLEQMRTTEFGGKKRRAGRFLFNIRGANHPKHPILDTGVNRTSCVGLCLTCPPSARLSHPYCTPMHQELAHDMLEQRACCGGRPCVAGCCRTQALGRLD